jgi:predicted nucleotidyltransferase
MEVQIIFPTDVHQRAALTAVRFFAAYQQVDTVLVVNSCARGTATPDSDLDLAVLVDRETSSEELRCLERLWLDFAATEPDTVKFKQLGRFTKIHLDVITGQFVAPQWDDGGGPDGFEIEVGNRVVYSAPLTAPGPWFRQLQSTWLPYYDEAQRLARLMMVRDACLYDLAHVPHFVRRGLHFQAFDRLYKAFQEFLQALFIARRTYPLAYNKWIREQVVNWLKLPELYAELPGILSIRQLESPELNAKADRLESLLQEWTKP